MFVSQIPIEGAAPEARHSHSACSYQGHVLVFGGLDSRGQPLGDMFLLKHTDRGFMWERVKTQPPAVPRSVLCRRRTRKNKTNRELTRHLFMTLMIFVFRYSHSAHVIEEKLVVVGGVWLHSDNVPGVTVIDLDTGISMDFQLDSVRSFFL